MRLHSLTLLAAVAAESATTTEPRKEALPIAIRLLNEAIEAAEAAQRRHLIESLATTTANVWASSPQGDQGSIWGTFDQPKNENEWDAQVEAQQEKNEDDDKAATISPTFMPTLNDSYENKEYIEDYRTMPTPISTPDSDVSISANRNDSTITLETNNGNSMKSLPAYMPSYAPTAYGKYDIKDRNEGTIDDKVIYETAAIKEMDDSR